MTAFARRVARRQARAVRARDQRLGRLVEADVAVRAQTENLQVDAAGALDRAFVAVAFALDVARGRR